MNAFHRLHALRLENDEVKAEMAEMRPRFERLRDRHCNGAAPVAVVADNLFQTPPDLAERLVALADIGPGHSVLEPSAGLGRLLAHVPEHAGEVVAVEVSPDCSRELFKNFPRVRLLQGDFLERSPGSFDRVIMNPPFRMRSDLRHIEHALKCLKPGGVLAGLCMAGPIRERALRDRCEVWEVIPKGAFRTEGTNVETILFKINN